MTWTMDFPHPGDMIRVHLDNGLLHFGIYVSDDEVIQFGLPPVDGLTLSARDVTVIATDIDVFRCGLFPETAQLTRAERKKARSPQEIVDYARSRLGTGGYHIIHNNCEHFANECVFGVKGSSQVEKVRDVWRKLLSADVYLAPLPSVWEEHPLYPPERMEEIAGCSNERVRIQKQFVWELLAFAMKTSYGVDMAQTDIHREKSGKWVCAKCFFSLSHTEGYAAAAVSKVPVGIDLERLDRGKDRSREFDRIACREEAKAIPQPVSELDFLTLWTAKESIFKRTGGSAFHPQRINTRKDPVNHYTLQEEGLLLAVSAECENVAVYAADPFTGKKEKRAATVGDTSWLD